MNIMNILGSLEGGKALIQKGESLGLDQNQLGSALGAMVPALARGVQSKADASGLDLSAILSQLGGGDAEAMVDAGSEADLDGQASVGEGILGQLLGTGEAQSALADKIAEKSGASTDAISQLMPSVTGLLTGVMSKAENGSLDIGSLLGGGAGGGMLGGLASMAMGFLGGGNGSGGGALQLLSFLDKDGDGSIIDDLLGK